MPEALSIAVGPIVAAIVGTAGEVAVGTAGEVAVGTAGEVAVGTADRGTTAVGVGPHAERSSTISAPPPTSLFTLFAFAAGGWLCIFRFPWGRDGDGVAEAARCCCGFMGESRSSDKVAPARWFVNLKGAWLTWQIE